MFYVYRITDLKSKVKRYYVGKHKDRNFDFEIGKTYFTSSKTIKKLWLNDINRFKVKIVRTFNTDSEALKFEAKYHHRLNVAKNEKFYNLQNQSNYLKFERAGLITVLNSDNKKETISLSEFYSNKDKYTPLNKNKVLTNDHHIVDKDTFIKNNLHGVNYNLLTVFNKELGKKERITKDEYFKNKNKYDFILNKITAYDTLNNKFVIINKEEFDGIRFKGVNFNRKFKTVKCQICSKEVSNTNFERHVKRHKTRSIFITNGFTTLKVSEFEYFNKYSNFKIVKHNGYWNGELLSLRVIGKLLKELDYVYQDSRFKENQHC